MAHYQYQRFTTTSGAEQVYTSASLVTPPANPANTSKSAIAYNLTNREVDWLRDTASLVWRKQLDMDILATITPTVSTGTVSSTQDSVRIANGTIPTASAAYQGVILEVATGVVNITPTSGPLNGIGQLNARDFIVCENSDGVWRWKKVDNTDTLVTITDLANGTVNIDNGVNPQTAQRPINELGILALNLVDPSADYFDVYRASTGEHVRVPAMRPSQASYLADGLNDTRAGSLGTITSGIYAVHDHIHAINKLSPFATPPTITFAGFTAPTGTVNLSYDTEGGTEETINYFYQGSLTIPNAIAWRNFTISNVAGFRFKSRVTNLYRLSAMAGYPGTNTMEKGQACDKYGNSATTYLYNASTLPGNVVNISTFRVEVTYTLI